MTGRRLLNKLVLALLGALILFPIFGPAWAVAQDNGLVVVLLSDDEAAYARPLESFRAEILTKVETFNLKGDMDRVPEVLTAILARKPALIFALGAKAAYAAKLWTADRPDLPVIFAMVLNWKKYDFLEGRRNIAGIASVVSAGTQLVNMTMFTPNVKRIGVVYSEKHSVNFVVEAREAAANLGLELEAVPIKHPRNFKHAFKEMAGRIDAFWILADPVIYTMDNVSWLNERCLKDRLVCIGQSKNVTKIGVLLAVDSDTTSIGSQAASMAQNILGQGQSPEDIGVMSPLGTRLFLNKKTSDKIGLELSRHVLDMANEIIEE